MRIWSPWIFASIALIAATNSTLAQGPHSYKPPGGYVPDAETATKIAVAVWEPIYGREKIASQKPYKARLVGGVWIVEGSLPESPSGRVLVVGGVAIAEISKDDGRVLRVSHGK
ncbi:MAG TPA: YbbC/YhhH family protein [Methylomirabilota bacterium]|nr:YbbC/YhhH family protein [Methylomirabilota bacterium]